MSRTSSYEQARGIFLRLKQATQKGTIGKCLFYHKRGGVYVIPLEKEPNRDQSTTLQHLVEIANDFCYEAPLPPPQRIIAEKDLKEPETLSNAAAAFLGWVAENQRDMKDQSVLVMPRAVLVAWLYKAGEGASIRGEIAFPVRDEILNEERLLDQARFACTIIAALPINISGQHYHLSVVLNGCKISDVTGDISPEALYQQYLEEIESELQENESEDEPGIADLVDMAIPVLESLPAVPLLQDWKNQPAQERPLMPKGWEIVDYSGGMLAFQDKKRGVLVLVGPPDQMPDDLIARIQKAEILYMD